MFIIEKKEFMTVVIRNISLPLAGLTIATNSELDSEIVVYDKKTNRLHADSDATTVVTFSQDFIMVSSSDEGVRRYDAYGKYAIGSNSLDLENLNAAASIDGRYFVCSSTDKTITKSSLRRAAHILATDFWSQGIKSLDLLKEVMPLRIVHTGFKAFYNKYGIPPDIFRHIMSFLDFDLKVWDADFQQIALVQPLYTKRLDDRQYQIARMTNLQLEKFNNTKTAAAFLSDLRDEEVPTVHHANEGDECKNDDSDIALEAVAIEEQHADTQSTYELLIAKAISALASKSTALASNPIGWWLDQALTVMTENGGAEFITDKSLAVIQTKPLVTLMYHLQSHVGESLYDGSMPEDEAIDCVVQFFSKALSYHDKNYSDEPVREEAVYAKILLEIVGEILPEYHNIKLYEPRIQIASKTSDSCCNVETLPYDDFNGDVGASACIGSSKWYFDAPHEVEAFA